MTASAGQVFLGAVALFGRLRDGINRQQHPTLVDHFDQWSKEAGLLPLEAILSTVRLESLPDHSGSHFRLTLVGARTSRGPLSEHSHVLPVEMIFAGISRVLWCEGITQEDRH